MAIAGFLIGYGVIALLVMLFCPPLYAAVTADYVAIGIVWPMALAVYMGSIFIRHMGQLRRRIHGQ